MRAATAIVGAIAVSSILIALAFVLSGGNGSSDVARTKTVTEIQEAAKPEAEEPSPSKVGGGAVGGPTQCGGGEFAVEGVSCEVGAEIHHEYAQGSRGGLVAEDPEGGASISVTCDEGTTPVTCEGASGARIYFAP
jgi:hypothetical protein